MKQATVEQLQDEIRMHQQVEKQLNLLTMVAQIAEFEHRLKEAEYHLQQVELEKEAVIQQMQAKQQFESQLHLKLGKALV